MVGFVVALMVGSATILSAPAPVHAEWSRTLSIDFFTNGDYGDGKGRVTSDDGAIDCSVDTGFESGTCSQHYVIPDFIAFIDITLTYTPAPGSYVCVLSATVCYEDGSTQVRTIRFERGSGGDYTSTPSFNRRWFTVRGFVSGPGRINGDGGGLACSVGGEVKYCAQYKYGTTATLTAVPDPGEPFNYWDGKGCADPYSTMCTLTVTGATDLTAQFGYAWLRAERTGQGQVCATGGFTRCTDDEGYFVAWLDANIAITLTATPAKGWAFKGWSAAPCKGLGAVCSFNLGTDVDVTAAFTRLATPSPTRTAPPTKAPATTTPTVAPTASPGTSPPAESVDPTDPPATGASDPPVTSPAPGSASASPAPDPESTISPPASLPPVDAAGGGDAGLSILPLALVALILAAALAGLGLARGRRTRGPAPPA